MKKINISLILLLSVLFFCSSCGSNIKEKSSEGRFCSVSVAEFSATIADSAVQVVDVRTHEEFVLGNIAGSVNIDVKNDNFALYADSLLDKNRRVAVYCRSGRRSKKAAEILSAQGFDVIELDKGYNAWVESEK